MDTILAVLLLSAVGLCSSQTPVLTQLIEPVGHAEGPHWNADTKVLNFVDINDNKLYQWEAATGDVTYVDVGGAIGFAIPVESNEGGDFIAGRDKSIITFNWSGKTNVTLDVEELDFLATVEQGSDQRDNRWNDAKADAEGRLWAGTMGYKAALYSLETHASVPLHQVNNVATSNGIAWNKANTVMYWIDTPTRKIDAFEFFVQAGVISNRHTVFDFTDYDTLEGSPDGMTIDSDGHLWVALWGGSSVICVNPVTGELLRQVALPANQVSSVVFGGDNLETLFVSTSRAGLSDEQLLQQPLAGALFKLERLGVKGMPANKVVRE